MEASIPDVPNGLYRIITLNFLIARIQLWWKAVQETHVKEAWNARALVLALSAMAFGALAEESYSPHVDRSHTTNVYWGDTHVHTALSSDGFIFGTRLVPDDAYRFAKGETIRAASGEVVRLRRPLDFLMVSDHAENMGVIARIAAGDEALLATEAGKRTAEALNYPVSLVEALNADTDDLLNAFNAATLRAIKADQGPAKGLGHADYGTDRRFERSVWEEVIANAERHNDPGRFTSFSGYEWTVASGGHRNVIFADGARKDRPGRAVLQLRQQRPRGSVGIPRRLRGTLGRAGVCDPSQRQSKRQQHVRAHDPPGRAAHGGVRESPFPLGAALRGDADQGTRRNPSVAVAERRVCRRRDIPVGDHEKPTRLEETSQRFGSENTGQRSWSATDSRQFLCPLRPQARLGPGSGIGRQSLQVRHDREHGLPHRPRDRRSEQLLGQDAGQRAQPEPRGDRMELQRIRLRGSLGC